MATFQSQINILAAANCGIHSRINQLEKSRLEVNYNKTFTTIKDTHDDRYITINNLGYNAYDAMLIIRNKDGQPLTTEREYHLMGFDGKSIDLGENTDLNAAIGTVMEQQTLKLLELDRVSIEGELARFDFSGYFSDSLSYVPLDETEVSINTPIKITYDGMTRTPIKFSNLITVSGSSYYTQNEEGEYIEIDKEISYPIYKTSDDENDLNPIVCSDLNPILEKSYYYYNENAEDENKLTKIENDQTQTQDLPIVKGDEQNNVPIKVSDLKKQDNTTYHTHELVGEEDKYPPIDLDPEIKDPIFKSTNRKDYTSIGFSDLKDDTDYYVELDTSSIKDFNETLTISAEPIGALYNEISLGNDETLQSGLNLTLINYSYDQLRKIHKFYWGYKDNDKIKYITIDIKSGALRLNTFTVGGVSFQLFQIELKDNEGKTIIIFPDPFLTPDDPSKPYTRLAGGHLWTEKPGKVLDENDAPYRNINIINNMKPLQFDIKDETEGTAPQESADQDITTMKPPTEGQ